MIAKKKVEIKNVPGNSFHYILMKLKLNPGNTNEEEILTGLEKDQKKITVNIEKNGEDFLFRLELTASYSLSNQ